MLEQNPKLQILGPQFHEISDKFKIGENGLRLTVCKLKVKTGGNKNENEITEEKMNQKRYFHEIFAIKNVKIVCIDFT